MIAKVDPDFWQGRKVFITGHTGFKGSWAALWLTRLKAEVFGYALPCEDPSHYVLAAVEADIKSQTGNILDQAALNKSIANFKPDTVLHFAAQSLVRRAHRRPAETFATNVQGTVNLFEAVCALPSPPTVLVTTTDKVYRNTGDGRRFIESDALGGSEPYSASKVGQEMVVEAYVALLAARGGRVLRARAGNVIGGGDFSEDRLVPDLVRAAQSDEPADIRNPEAERPFQHVLDCLAGYFIYLQKSASVVNVPPALNFGPAEGSVLVRELADAISSAMGHSKAWRTVTHEGPTEAPALALNSSLARSALNWDDMWPGHSAVEHTTNWYRDYIRGADMRAKSLADIDEYMVPK